MAQPKESNPETNGNGELKGNMFGGYAPWLRTPPPERPNQTDCRNGQKRVFGGVKGFEFDGETGQFVPVKTK